MLRGVDKLKPLTCKYIAYIILYYIILVRLCYLYNNPVVIISRMDEKITPNLVQILRRVIAYNYTIWSVERFIVQIMGFCGKAAQCCKQMG